MFRARKFGIEFFFEIMFCPKIFLVLIFAPIRSSASLVIQSTRSLASPGTVVQSTNDFFRYYSELIELRIRTEL